MKHKSFIVTLIVLAFMFAIACVPAFAGVNHQVDIPANKVWKPDESKIHDTNYSHVGTNLLSVTPLTGSDFFTRLRCRILNSSGTVIIYGSSGYIVLSEGSGVWSILIKNGYYNTSTVYFQFSGNSNAAAYAIVNNYGTYDTNTDHCW